MAPPTLLFPPPLRTELQQYLLKDRLGRASWSLNEFLRAPDARHALRHAVADSASTFLRAVRRGLLWGPFHVVVQGVPVDDLDVLGALVCLLGQPAMPYRDPTFALLRELRSAATVRNVAGTDLAEYLHTDSTNWWRPHDLSLLLCRRPDTNGGGASRVLPIDAMVADVASQIGPCAVRDLRQVPLPWAVDPGLGGGAAWQPALGRRGVRWQHYRNEEALEREGVHIDRGLRDAIREVDDVLNTSSRCSELLLGVGDMLIVHNRRALHARTAVAGGSQRDVVHAKVHADPVMPHPALQGGRW